MDEQAILLVAGSVVDMAGDDGPTNGTSAMPTRSCGAVRAMGARARIAPRMSMNPRGEMGMRWPCRAVVRSRTVSMRRSSDASQGQTDWCARPSWANELGDVLCGSLKWTLVGTGPLRAFHWSPVAALYAD